MTALDHALCARLIARVKLARKEWDAEAHDRGDTCETDGYEPSDYVDGWNAALDEHAQPLADQLEGALAAIDAKQRGYDDLHDMVTGSGDIWTKVDKLLQRMTSDRSRSTAIESRALVERDAALADMERLKQAHASALADMERLKQVNASLIPGAMLTATELERLRVERDGALKERDELARRLKIATDANVADLDTSTTTNLVHKQPGALKPRAIAVLCALRQEPRSTAQLYNTIGDDHAATTRDLLEEIANEALIRSQPGVNHRWYLTIWGLTNDGVSWLETNGLSVSPEARL